MRLRSRTAAVAVACLLAVGLTGCETANSFVLKAQLDLGLNQLTTTLDELAGISTDYTLELTGDYAYNVSVKSTSTTDLTEQQFVDVALAVSDELGAGSFEGLQIYYTLDVPEGTLYSASNFDLLSDDELTTEIGYLYDLTDAYGAPLGISFDQAWEPGARYHRNVGELSPSSEPNWDALRAVPNAGTTDSSWGLGGIGGGGGEFPPKTVTDLVAEIYRVVPPTDWRQSSPENFLTIDWHIATVDVAFMSFSHSDLSAPAASPDWPKAVSIAKLLASSHGLARDFAYYGDGSTGSATVYFGTCPHDAAVLNDGDAPLAAALTAAGVPDVAAGLC